MRKDFFIKDRTISMIFTKKQKNKKQRKIKNIVLNAEKSLNDNFSNQASQPVFSLA
jgi:DNA-binding transcriptional regulator GbsR (MarR family)